MKIGKNLVVRFYEKITKYWLTQIIEIAGVFMMLFTASYSIIYVSPPPEPTIWVRGIVFGKGTVRQEWIGIEIMEGTAATGGCIIIEQTVNKYRIISLAVRRSPIGSYVRSAKTRQEHKQAMPQNGTPTCVHLLTFKLAVRCGMPTDSVIISMIKSSTTL